MSTIPLEEAQVRLAELVGTLTAGSEVVITQGDLPVARLLPVDPPARRPVFGSCKGMMTILSDDDEHLKDFAEYMP